MIARDRGAASEVVDVGAVLAGGGLANREPPKLDAGVAWAKGGEWGHMDEKLVLGFATVEHQINPPALCCEAQLSRLLLLSAEHFAVYTLLIDGRYTSRSDTERSTHHPTLGSVSKLLMCEAGCIRHKFQRLQIRLFFHVFRLISRAKKS